MKLTKKQETQATVELLGILYKHKLNGGVGMRTLELQGTPKFHGERTLSSQQIIRLLRKSGQVDARTYGNPGFFTYL